MSQKVHEITIGSPLKIKPELESLIKQGFDVQSFYTIQKPQSPSATVSSILLIVITN